MSEELESIKEKFTHRAQMILESAVQESKNRQHFYLGVEHIFIAFAK